MECNVVFLLLDVAYSAVMFISPLRSREDGIDDGQHLSSADASVLRRAQSHGSLLDRESDYNNSLKEFKHPNGDRRSGSYANLDSGIGMGMERNQWGGSYQAGLNGSLDKENLKRINNYYESPSDAVKPSQDRRAKNGDRNFTGQASVAGGSSRGRTTGVHVGNGPATTVLSSAQLLPSNDYASPPSSLPVSGYSRPSRTSGSVAKIAAVHSSGLNNDWSTVDAHVSGICV